MMSIGLTTKLKILVSFYQIMSSFDIVYGVNIHPSLKKFFDWVFNIFSLDFLGLNLPENCIGPVSHQLIAITTWPYIVIIFASSLLLIRQRYAPKVYSLINILFGELRLVEGMKYRVLYVAIFVLYFTLPTISRALFHDGLTCKSFRIRDSGDVLDWRFLLADMNIRCDSGNDEYYKLQIIFWTAFSVWVVLIPSVFLRLLSKIGHSVRKGSPTKLAQACRFLWDDYKESMMIWEVLDIFRRIFLIGLIMIIDRHLEGSDKTLRLSIAAVFSTSYNVILTIARPYKRTEDLYLAVTSNALLIMCFVLGISLHLCGSGVDAEADEINGSCTKFVGLNMDSYTASVFVVVLYRDALHYYYINHRNFNHAR